MDQTLFWPFGIHQGAKQAYIFTIWAVHSTGECVRDINNQNGK